MTIDQLIAELQTVKRAVGGDAEVNATGYYSHDGETVYTDTIDVSYHETKKCCLINTDFSIGE